MNNFYKRHVLLILNLEVLYFLKLCPIFVGPTQYQFTKYSNFLEPNYFFDRLKLIFYLQMRNSMIQLTLLCRVMERSKSFKGVLHHVNSPKDEGRIAVQLDINEEKKVKVKKF